MRKSQCHYTSIAHWVILISFLFCTPSFASWKKVLTLAEPIGSVFFSDQNHGLVGTGNNTYNYTLEIWITSDGGVTWIQANVPIGDGQISQISMNPNGTGYASIFSANNPDMNLWMTADGGYNWKDISSLTGAYGTGVGFNGQFAYWRVVNGKTVGTNGVFTMPGGNTLITPGPNTKGYAEAWGAYGDSAQGLWYIITEQSRDLFISKDGVNWQQRFNYGPMMTGGYMTGEIIGAGNKLYVQTEKNGVFRGSISDSGASWVNVGGPSNVYDTRTMYVSGCNGQLIYAFDDAGALWESNDGGDGTLSNPDSLEIQHINFRQISSCQNATKKAWFVKHGCAPFVLTNAAFINSGGVYTLLQSAPLPDTLYDGDTIFFTVKFDPNRKPGGYNGVIKMHGYFEATNGAGQVEADSNITITGVANPNAPQTETNLSEIDFGGASICGGEVDSIFTIKNTGCDTIVILSGPGSLDSAFTVDTINFPFSLPPDSTVVIHVHFKPRRAGSTSPSFLDFKISSEGISNDIKFYVQGNGIPGLGLLSAGDQTFNFDTLNFCSQPDSTIFLYVNIGCGPLTLGPMGGGSDPDFRVTEFPVPVMDHLVLFPGDTFKIKILFIPTSKGMQIGDYHSFQLSDGINPDKLVTAYFNGFVKNGNPVLSSPLGNINFGTTSLCEDKDTTLTVNNTGCDTLIISKAQVSGLGFAVSGISFPIIILPGKSAQLKVSAMLDTAGGKLTSVDSLVITSNSDSAFAPIKLTRSVIPHREVGMYLDTKAQRGTDQDVVYYDIKETPGKSFTGADVKQIDLDLQRNADLLEFILAKSSGNNISGLPNGTSFSLSSNSEITADANGILASVAFRVYLTKDSTTDITLTNVRMNGLDSSGGPCLLTFSTSGTAYFNYDFVCGEKSIAGSMNGIMPMRIISIRPNPAQDETEILLESATRQRANIEIINTLGEKIFSQDQSLNSGQNRIHLDTRNLSDGIYLARINSGRGSVTQKFLKVK